MIDSIRDILGEIEIEANTMLAPVVAAALTNAFFSALIYESRGGEAGEEAARRAAKRVGELYETLVDMVEARGGENVLF